MAFQQAQDQSIQKDKYVGWHVVALMDLLGQQDALRKVTALPNLENQEEIDAFKRKISEFYEPLIALRQWFAGSVKSFMEGGIDASRLTPEEQKLLKKIRSTPIFYRHFSDSVVAHIPLRDNIGKIHCRAIYGVLGATAITFLSCMSHKWAIRGAIEIGLAMDIEGDEIYGPAIARAHTLESKVAQYPRIVIGEELIRYLKGIGGVISNPTFPIDDRVNAGAAAKSIELLAEDNDGQVIVDYLGATIRNVLLDTEVVKNAYNFIIEECKRYKELQNSKLGFRYSLLRNYFESRLPDWGISMQSE
jgi:hypothetical protein